MAWSTPERSWRFAIGGDPPGDFPAAWASAAHAVTRDLSCRRHGRIVSFANVGWHFAVSDGWMAVGFAAPGDPDISPYRRCMGYQMTTSTAQAMVWLAGDVQYELTGYEFVQWPIEGRRILDPRLIDDHAVWVEPSTNTVAARIGELCAQPGHG